MKFCPNCGTPLEIRIVEDRPRDYCPNCQRIHYRQLKVGAGGIVEQDGKILLLQRTQNPFKGFWNLPAGYAEADESPYQTVAREIAEEIGLVVEVDRLLDVYYFDDDPRGNGILIVFLCRVTGGEHRVSDETAAFRYFAPDELPAQLAGGGHDLAILSWQSSCHL